MSNWKCPSRKRRLIKYSPQDHKCLHTVILRGIYFGSRGDYHSNHEIFEWLHSSIDGSWHCLEDRPFTYAVHHNDSWHHKAFQFGDDGDAVLFQLKFNGRLLAADFEERREAEAQFRASLTVATYLAREDRIRHFPGLDDLVLAAARQLGS